MERMFDGATSFNSDVSSWDIGSVTNLNDMFQGATSFNQNLCAWGETFPYNPEYSGFEYNVVNDMFLDSGCTYQDTPQEDTKGPFCASDCSASAAETVSAENETLSSFYFLRMIDSPH